MGIIKHFSSSSLDKSTSIFTHWLSKSSIHENTICVNDTTLPNPNPYNYTIIDSKQINNFLIILIKYLDCINYEGKKILIYKNCSVEDLKKQKYIDPHFSDNKKYHSPIARFEPTEDGFKMAKFFVTNYK